MLERPRYFPRKLITDAEMTLEQDYFRNRLRLHNRMLHGWGVVCGAIVCTVPKTTPEIDPACEDGDAHDDDMPGDSPGTEPWKVVVKPGYILGPYGDEIVIDCPQIVDVRKRCVDAVSPEPCGPVKDPWCSEVHAEEQGGELFVAVRYKEFKARPVRVQPAGCGCDDTQCEYSRWRDGYEICMLTDCPDSHEDPPSSSDLFHGPLRHCPECPPEPWVVLAKVTVDDNGTVTVDNCECRRLVASFGCFWWHCKGNGDGKASDKARTSKRKRRKAENGDGKS